MVPKKQRRKQEGDTILLFQYLEYTKFHNSSTLQFYGKNTIGNLDPYG